jgi:hypothetical protein
MLQVQGGDNLHVELHDVTGRLFISTNESLISLDGISPGVYIVKASDQSSVKTKKIVIE